MLDFCPSWTCTDLVHAVMASDFMRASGLLSGGHRFLGVTHPPPLALITFLPHLPDRSLNPRRERSDKIPFRDECSQVSHSLTWSRCGSLCHWPSTVRRSFSREGWAMLCSRGVNSRTFESLSNPDSSHLAWCVRMHVYEYSYMCRFICVCQYLYTSMYMHGEARSQLWVLFLKNCPHCSLRRSLLLT